MSTQGLEGTNLDSSHENLINSIQSMTKFKFYLSPLSTNPLGSPQKLFVLIAST